ncbi:MAG: BatA domain-containing protein, partial [bacterium]|nr:BatA domain-containing protein [bacterium]
MAGLENPLGLAALAAVAVLVVLLRFARRGPLVTVGSLWLWRQVPAAPRVHRRVRTDLPFWLQLAAVVALAAALARPFWSAPARPGGGAPLVAVLDVSASMQTHEAAGPRLETARALLDAELAALPTGTPAMLVAAGARPRVAMRWTTDVAAVRAALANLAATDEPTRLPRALALAEAEQRRRPGTRIAVATDLPPAAGDVAWHAVGATDDNAAVTRLAVDAPPFAPVRAATVTATVRNFAARPRAVTVRADVDGVPWATRPVILAPRGSAEIRLEAPPRDGVVTVALDGGDALAVDDRAVTALAAARPLDLLLVSESDTLAAALSALVGSLPDGRLEIVNPAGLRERDAGSTASALHPVAILDGVVPGHAGALARPALLVAPPPDNPVCPGRGVAAHPAVVDWDDTHPILAGVEGLAALGVPRATVLRRPPWGTEVLHAATARGGFPLLVAGEVDGWRRACLAAPLPTPLTDADALPLVVVTLS